MNPPDKPVSASAAPALGDVVLRGNTLADIGGPGIHPRQCRRVIPRDNTVNRSGPSLDPRMNARSSGIRPWRCENVLMEHNRFPHARGKADACGMRVDYGCRDVIVQYNLSADHEGGYAERGVRIANPPGDRVGLCCGGGPHAGQVFDLGSKAGDDQAEVSRLRQLYSDTPPTLMVTPKTENNL
jgi:hypothetical protein